MSRLWQCGFEWNTLTVFSTVVGAPVVSAARARTGTYSLLADTGGKYGQVVLPAAITEVFIRMWVNLDTASSDPTRDIFLWIQDDIGTVHLSFRFCGTTNQVQVMRGIGPGTLLATSKFALPFDEWVGIFIRATIADAGGIVQVRFNASTAPNDIDFSGDTRMAGDANIQTLDVGNYGNIGMAIYFDDIAINDTAGVLNNSWPADGGINGLSPTGAGNYTQWTPSAGANWDCVEEKPPNDDVDYVSESTVNDKDTYGLSNTPGAGAVAAVCYWLRARKEAAGDTVNTRRLLRIGGTDYTGATHVLSTSYQSLKEILEASPATLAAWTAAELDAMEAGQECV